MTSAVRIACIAVLSCAVPLTTSELVAQESGTQPAVAQTQITAADSAQFGMVEGQTAARSESTSRWVFGGFLGGATLGPIGAGLAWMMANNSDVTVPVQRVMLLASQESPTFVRSYEDAYAESLRDRRKRSALIGGAIGTAALAAIATTVWAVYYYY